MGTNILYNFLCNWCVWIRDTLELGSHIEFFFHWLDPLCPTIPSPIPTTLPTSSLSESTSFYSFYSTTYKQTIEQNWNAYIAMASKPFKNSHTYMKIAEIPYYIWWSTHRAFCMLVFIYSETFGYQIYQVLIYMDSWMLPCKTQLFPICLEENST